MLKRSQKFLSIFLMFIVAFVFIFPQASQSASTFKIDPQNVATSASIEYCIGFPVGGGVDADDYFEVNFPAGFDLTDLTISNTSSESELELYPSDDCTGSPRITETIPGTADNSRDEASVSGQRITLVVDSGLTTNQWWSMKFVDKTDADANAVVSPAVESNYFFNWALFNEGVQDFQGGDFLYVGNLNKVDINANVDPSLTLTLSSLTCTLGTFSDAAIKTCNYYSEVDTNASSGYTAYIKADGDLRNATNSITNVSDDEVTATDEEYGVATSDADFAGLDIDQQETDCAGLNNGSAASAVALTTSDQSYATASEPVNNDQVTLCHAVAISGTTPAGAYNQEITITVVGNY